MSYSALQQSPDEIDYLVGATLTKVRVKKGNPAYYEEDALELSFTLKAPITDQDGTTSDRVKLEVWQDPEGNGPGFLALTAVVKPRKARAS